MSTTSFGERLQTALEAANKSRADLAAVLRGPTGKPGVSVSAVGQVINGVSRAMSAENSALAARFLGVNHHWLATGVGPMNDRPLTPGPTQAEPPPAWGSTDAQVLRQFQTILKRMDPAMRQGLADLLVAWVMDGAQDDRLPAIANLIRPSEKPDAPARKTGT